jgi:hypothetical protein
MSHRSGGSCAVAITWEQIEARKLRLHALGMRPARPMYPNVYTPPTGCHSGATFRRRADSRSTCSHSPYERIEKTARDPRRGRAVCFLPERLRSTCYSLVRTFLVRSCGGGVAPSAGGRALPYRVVIGVCARSRRGTPRAAQATRR